MFGFGDRETPETARQLFLQAQEVSGRYLPRPIEEIADIVIRDFPEERRFVHYDQITFGYAHLPDFNFGIMKMLNAPTLTIFGSGRYDGFMLQRPSSYDAWHISVDKPISRPLGPKAKRLGEIFKHQYGATNPGEALGRFMRR